MRRLILPILLLSASAAYAQEGTDRFQIERDGEGYVRMDSETGAMSLCREDGDQLVCRSAADDRDAMLTETEEMRARIDALEARVKALEGAPAVRLPSDSDIERSLGIMERFVRRFRDAAEGETTPPPAATPAPNAPPAPPAPDRTNLP